MQRKNSMIGQQILNYKIESLLGEGGMGSVYLAVHMQLSRKVAIKALNPSLVKNPGIRVRFKNEASTLSSLHHPNIVILFDYLEEENGLYLIMEYVEGKTLDDYIQTVSGPIPESKAIPLFMQILDAFAYAHEQGVIHRDVKPANIMITGRERMKILDYGIAKLLSQRTHTLTQAGTKMGTVLYMSPEQVKGEPVDKRSDIYSLGVTLFQMLTGRSPYDDPNATEFAVYNKIVNEPLPRASQYYPNVSARMQAVIDKATAKKPEERFQDCQEFKEAFMGTMSLPVGSTITFQNKTSKPSQENPSVTKVTSTQKKSANKGWVLALMLAVLLVAGWLFLRKKEDTPVQTNTPVNTETTLSQGSSEKKKEKKTDPPPVETPDEVQEEEPTQDTRLTSTDAARYINLVCEIAEEDTNEITEESSEVRDRKLTVRATLTNTSEMDFDNVSIRITYFNANDNEIGNYIYEHGRLESGQEERFLIDRKILASRVECAIASAQSVESVQEEIQ
ncbi:serine/threonine protein kinase [Rhodocytophaga rosea]|uniref:non-specific serine/threonine protein kinase n=1 Tax=Rhodocytophaga rosea TaxID=2704465 RepID=A0A6C0GGJ7_9BACT|nr:serine/threonine-protein kinase [Rhodocytophaga rosea]QHT67005.1 serine/threonine protein kinase [Rhodocytophaga rosea]